MLRRNLKTGADVCLDEVIVKHDHVRQPPAVFKDGVWNRGLPDVIVFDDDFVEANVCSGLEIASQHRKNLHDLVLGAEAVVLGRQYKALVEKVEDHNRKLREREGAIGTSLRGGLTVAEFSALKALPDVESKLIAAQQAVDAATDVQLVRAADAFEEFALPRIDIEAVEELVRRDLPGLDAAAMSQVQERLASLVGDGEDWVSSGVAHVNHRRNWSGHLRLPGVSGGELGKGVESVD